MYGGKPVPGAGYTQITAGVLSLVANYSGEYGYSPLTPVVQFLIEMFGKDSPVIKDTVVTKIHE